MGYIGVTSPTDPFIFDPNFQALRRGALPGKGQGGSTERQPEGGAGDWTKMRIQGVFFNRRLVRDIRV